LAREGIEKLTDDPDGGEEPETVLFGLDGTRDAKLRHVPVVESPIIVMGCPRSGTTAMGFALGTHPELWASPHGSEANFIHGLLRDAPDQYKRSQFGNNITETGGIRESEWMRAIGVSINTLMTRQSGGVRWIDHTPRNVDVSRQIATAFPDARFIHVLRDGRRVVESLLALAARRPRYTGFTSNFVENCERWVQRVSQGRQFFAEHPESCYQVTNEAVSADPGAAFDALQTFLGVAPSAQAADHWRMNTVNSSFDRTNRPVGPWGNLTSPQQREFSAIAGPLMVELGYCQESDLVTA
jgi:Sulfotransferase family